MKKFNFRQLALVFLAGFVLGGAGVGTAVYYSIIPAGLQPALVKVTPQQAHDLVHQYALSLPSTQCKVLGFKFGVEQLNVMNQVYQANPALAGFRIYMGKTPTGEDVAIVAGIGQNGSDDLNLLYRSSWKIIGPCPPACDSPSPISDL